MLRSEIIEELLEPQALKSSQPPLPLSIRPAPEEALLSWLLRLATRLGVSLHALAKVGFGVDDRLGHTQWWRRPDSSVLQHIAIRTGIPLSRLRHMTLEPFEPPYRNDEAPARFSGRHWERAPPIWHRHTFAICGLCLQDSAIHYLRVPWLIGWVAVCPHHGTILIEQCNICGSHLRTTRLARVTTFAPQNCARCGCCLLDEGDRLAHPAVAQLQAALLRAKCDGITDLEGLGCFTWREVVTLADVLIGMLWTELALAERIEILRLFTSDPLLQPIAPETAYGGRYASLQLLAWLTAGWPDGPGTQLAKTLLRYWLTLDSDHACALLLPTCVDPRCVRPAHFERSTRERLRVLAEAPLTFN